MRVSLLITCVVDVVAPEVAEAAVRLLRAAGCEVTCNLDQTCCGQPAWNAGFAEDAATVARTTLAALEADLDAGADAVVVPAGSCATMVRVFWPELFEVVGDHDAAARARRVGERTRELTELLAERADQLPPCACGRPAGRAARELPHAAASCASSTSPPRWRPRSTGCEVVDMGRRPTGAAASAAPSASSCPRPRSPWPTRSCGRWPTARPTPRCWSGATRRA